MHGGGILDNYKGMPVDCPQRDERQPWLRRPHNGLGKAFILITAHYIVNGHATSVRLTRRWLHSRMWPKPSGCTTATMLHGGSFTFACDMLYAHSLEIVNP